MPISLCQEDTNKRAILHAQKNAIEMTKKISKKRMFSRPTFFDGAIFFKSLANIVFAYLKGKVSDVNFARFSHNM